jgi:DNA mismatch repair protein MutL
MSKINILDEQITNLIAAGEVIVRPGNCIKELIENSIDAKATNIYLEVLSGGKVKILIQDNGEGMDEIDAKNCFIRHATSKLSSKADLFYISSLGFRGEALPSIASVSKLNMTTSKDNITTNVVIEGGKMISVTNGTSAPQGTKIEVNSLFYNTPARYKYLKNDYVENDFIISVVEKLALSHPEISFTLLIDNKQVLKTDGTNSLISTIGTIFGFNLAKILLPISTSNADYKLDGFITPSYDTRANKQRIIIFVNSRLIKSYILTAAIIDGFGNSIPSNRYPSAIINITIDKTIIDVNVHPSKDEIRIANENNLASFIKESISALINKNITYPTIDIVSKVTDLSAPTFDNTNETQSENLNLIQDGNDGFETNLIARGQIKSTYIIAEGASSFYLNDQHAAMERINFEKYETLFKQKDNFKMSLLSPIIIQVTPAQSYLLDKEKTKLTTIGLNLSLVSPNTYKLEEVPAWMSNINVSGYLNEIIGLISSHSQIDEAKLMHSALASLACHHSLRANKSITLAQMQDLINQLANCKHPQSCPHGRPIMINFSVQQLEKFFKRSGF